MKRIRVNSVLTPDPGSSYTREKRFYKIPLGWGRSIELSSKKKVAAFLAAYNSFLTEKVNDLNRVFTQQIVFYREIWPYIEQNQALDYQGRIDRITQQFNRVFFTRYQHTTDGNYIISGKIERLIADLENLALDLEQDKQVKTFTFHRHTSRYIRNQLQYIEKGIENFVPDYLESTPG